MLGEEGKESHLEWRHLSSEVIVNAWWCPSWRWLNTWWEVVNEFLLFLCIHGFCFSNLNDFISNHEFSHLYPFDSLPHLTEGRVFKRLSDAYCHLDINHDNVSLCFPVHHAWAALKKVCSVLLHRSMLFNFSGCLSILPDFHKTPWKHFVCLESQEWLGQESK